MEDSTQRHGVQDQLKKLVGKASDEGIIDFVAKLRSAENSARTSSALTDQQVEAARLLSSGNLLVEEVAVFIDCTVNEISAWQELEAFQNKMSAFLKIGLLNMAPMAPKVLKEILLKGDNRERIAAAKLLMGVVNIGAEDGGSGDLEDELKLIEARGRAFDEGMD